MAHHVYILGGMMTLTTEQITEYNANHAACRGLGRYLYRTGERMTLYTDWYWKLAPDARKAVQEGWEDEAYNY